MAHILIMPRQGNTVESCIITDWKVIEGDEVTADTIVCEVETDKASFEVPAGAAGIVLKILKNAGDDVPVLEPIAVIGKADENWQESLNMSSSKETSVDKVEAQPEKAEAPMVVTESGIVIDDNLLQSPKA
jgi:pyruvate dehydrogenase E2 component (dihydrolipoamide acetyltransferase)